MRRWQAARLPPVSSTLWAGCTVLLIVRWAALGAASAFCSWLMQARRRFMGLVFLTGVRPLAVMSAGRLATGTGQLDWIGTNWLLAPWPDKVFFRVAGVNFEPQPRAWRTKCKVNAKSWAQARMKSWRPSPTMRHPRRKSKPFAPNLRKWQNSRSARCDGSTSSVESSPA